MAAAAVVLLLLRVHPSERRPVLRQKVARALRSALRRAKRRPGEPPADYHGPETTNSITPATSLAHHSQALADEIGTDVIRGHPALRALAAQLAYLYGVDHTGPPEDVLDHLETNAWRPGRTACAVELIKP